MEKCTTSIWWADISLSREFQLWRPLLMIVFYHQTKTPISFWCRQGLNSRSLIQSSETLPVELTVTHNWHISLYIFITTPAFLFWEQWDVISTLAWLDLHVFIFLILRYIYIYILNCQNIFTMVVNSFQNKIIKYHTETNYN